MPAATTAPEPLSSPDVPSVEGPPRVSSPRHALVAGVPRPQRADFRQPGAAPRWRIGAGAAVVVVLALCAVLVGVSGFASARQATTTVESAPTSTAPARLGDAGEPATGSTPGGDRSSTGAGATGSVFVHVLGRVLHPGLYEVPSGSRLIDVVSAAGGLAPDADQSRVNLAEKVVDGVQVTIPAVGDPDVPASPGAPGATGSASAHGAPANGTTSPKVDLNTADAAGLEQLPGVGPATAQALLDWRAEHGRFEAVEDLLDVSGIGDKKFEKLRDLVTAS